jgi:hypothetical protein
LSFVISCFTAIQNGRLGGAVLLATLAISCILCCIGLLQRRLYGAVMFHVAYLLILLTPAILAAMNNSHQTPPEAQQSGMGFLYYLVRVGIWEKVGDSLTLLWITPPHNQASMGLLSQKWVSCLVITGRTITQAHSHADLSVCYEYPAGQRIVCALCLRRSRHRTMIATLLARSEQ